MVKLAQAAFSFLGVFGLKLADFIVFGIVGRKLVVLDC
jgi:hypothetical protein